MEQPPGRFPPPPEQPPYGFAPPGSAPPGPPHGFYPLNVDRVVQLTISLFRFRWRTYLGIALAVLVPLSVAVGVLQAATLEALARFNEDVIRLAESGQLTVEALASLIPWPALILSWGVSFLFGLGSYLAVAAFTDATAIATSGGLPTTRSSLRRSLERLPTLAVVYTTLFLATLGIILVGGVLAGSLFLLGSEGGFGIQPGLPAFMGLVVVVGLLALLVFVTLRWALVPNAVMIDRLGAVDALRRSWRLVSGSTWRVLGYVLLFAFLTGLPALILTFLIAITIGTGVEQTPTGVVIDPTTGLINTVLTGTVAALVSPFGTIALTLVYFDIRWRRGETVAAPGGEASSPARETGQVG